MRNRSIQRRDAVVGSRTRIPQYIIHNQSKPIPLSNQALRNISPKDVGLSRLESSRIGEPGRERRTEGSIADEGGGCFENRVETPSSDAVEEHAEKEALEEGGGASDEGAAGEEEDPG